MFASTDRAAAQSNTCNSGQITCSIETRTNAGLINACTDGVDNDGNGMTDAADIHCQSEVLCQDLIDNDAGGGTDGADTDCDCLQPVVGGNPPCTAGDITIAYTASPVVSDGCINSSDTLVAALTAELTAHQPQRYDLGMWVALDGGDAKTGALCTRQILQPVGAPLDLLGGSGPYRDLDGDVCGDELNGSTSTYNFPFLINVACSDISGLGGFVDIGQCGSWDNNDNTLCSNPSTGVPGTGSKCRCERADTSIPGPNVRAACSAFTTPTGLGGNGFLDPGETASFGLGYTNTVAGCAPEDAVAPDFGRLRCGTASFVRFTIGYTAGANLRGNFTDGANVAVPTCPSTIVVASNNGVLCNDTTNNRLIWAPRDTSLTNTYGVINPFVGTQTLPFKYTLTDFVGTSPIVFSAAIRWDDAVDTTPTDSAVSASEAVDLTGSIAQSCTDCTCSSSLTTTPVTLSSFAASENGREVRFDWSTATEVGNVGFDLYANVGGKRVKLNREPIRTTSSNSLEPKSYSASFAVPEGAESFSIVDLDTRGNERAHGPFRLGQRHGRRAENMPIEWPAIRLEHGVAVNGTGQATIRSISRGAKPGSGTTSAAIELHVDQSGLYRVTHESLVAAGFNLSGNNSSQLGLSSRGGEVPIFVNSKGPFGPGSYIEFYGEALDTIYTKTNVYQLRTGQQKPARVAESKDVAAGAATASYLETRRFERDRGYSLTAPIADPFYDTEMLVFTTAGTWPFDFAVDGSVAGTGGAALRAEVYGGTQIRGIDPDHRVEFLVNGVLLGESTFDGTGGRTFEAAIPAGLLTEGANQLVLRLPGVPGAPYDLITIDGFSVTYPRRFSAIAGRLDFSAAGRRLEVTGLPSGDVVAYRRDAGGLTRLEKVQAVADGGSFRAIVPGATNSASYSVASVGALLAPKAIRAARPDAGLLAGSAQYLIIAHPAFQDGLGELVAARSAQGLSVKVVNVEDIYAKYSGGIFDAQAIRDYVAAAYASLGTRYVLLVGGDSYDYFNYLGFGAVSFVPSLYVETGDIVRHAPADSVYADVDRDGVQDLAIGRFPVRTAAELANVIAKTLEYDAKSYGGTAILTADYSDAAANQPFDQASDQFRNALPSPDWTISSSYLDSVALVQARADLFSAFNQGTGLINYVGHSGLTSWGSPLKPVSQHLFSITDVDGLANAGSPGVVTQQGCWNTYYASPRTESLGTRLMLADDKGAAAVIGASTLAQDANGNDLAVLLAARVDGATLGEALWQAKQALKSSALPQRDLRDVLFGWTLLGDPALRLAQ